MQSTIPQFSKFSWGSMPPDPPSRRQLYYVENLETSKDKSQNRLDSHHSYSFPGLKQVYERLQAHTTAFSSSFFPRAIRAWNSLSQTVMSSQTLASFKHNVHRFVTYCVRCFLLSVIVNFWVHIYYQCTNNCHTILCIQCIQSCINYYKNNNNKFSSALYMTQLCSRHKAVIALLDMVIIINDAAFSIFCGYDFPITLERHLPYSQFSP